jgi:transposase
MRKLQDVLLKAMAKKISWGAAAEIIEISDRTIRRWHERWKEHGYDGLMDRRKSKPSTHRVAVKTVEEVLRLYREKYYDLNIRYFHEKLSQVH